MVISNCKERENITQNKKLTGAYSRIQKLIDELNKKEIPTEISTLINQEISVIDSCAGTEKELIKTINKIYSKVLNLVNKELGIVAKNYYQNLWMAIGMSAFGLPFGVVLFTLTKNPAFIAIGLPLGLPIGLAIGMQKDKKAEKENMQIQLEI